LTVRFTARPGRRDLREHVRHYAWVYLLVIALSYGLWNLIYAQTAYRTPQSARVDVYVQSAAGQEDLNAYLESIRKASLPGLELASAVMLIPPAAAGEYYANVQLVTYLAAREGDIYMLTVADFKRLASQGAFLDLGPAVQSGLLDASGIALDAGRVKRVFENERGEMSASETDYLFGIPADGLDGFLRNANVDSRGLVLCVAEGSGNRDMAVAFLGAMIQAARGGGIE